MNLSIRQPCTALVLNSTPAVFNGGEFASYKTLSSIWEHFGSLQLECGADTGICWGEASEDTKHPTPHRTALHCKELSGPRCQYFRG